MIDSWILNALATMLITGTEVTLFKLIPSFKNVSVYEAILIIFVFCGIISFFILIYNGKNIKNKVFNKTTLFFIFMALLFVFQRMFFIKSITESPNPGYSLSIINMNIIVVLFLSYLFFGLTINIYTLLGIILAFSGICIIIRNS